MSLLSVPLLQVTASHLQALVDNKVAEGLQLDYKKDLPGQSDADKREFLADASSFANAQGGDLIFGIEEENDIPTSVPGLDREVIAPAVIRLESMLRDGLAPRANGIRSHEVVLTEERSALVVRVPRSLAAPHMVTFGNLSRFFGRVSRGKYQLDVHELRSAFLRAATVLDAARTWRLERVSRLLAAEVPISLYDEPKVVFHVVPLATDSIDLQSVATLPVQPKPLYSDTSNGRFNLDGLLYYSPAQPQPAHTYLQVFRNGALESVAASVIERDGDPLIRSVILEQTLIRQVDRAVAFYSALDIGPPFAVMISLLGVRGFRILPRTANRHFTSFRLPLEIDNLLLPDVVIEDLPVR